MYEPQAADLLMKLGLSVAEGKSASPEGSPEGAPEGGAARTVPVEGVQALSAAMSLIGGDSGVSADVRLGVVFVFCARAQRRCAPLVAFLGVGGRRGLCVRGL